MQLYSVIFKSIDISKAAKTEVSATKGKKFVQTSVDECQQIRSGGFNLAITWCYFKIVFISKTAKTKVPATKEKEILITVKCPLSTVNW